MVQQVTQLDLLQAFASIDANPLTPFPTSTSELTITKYDFTKNLKFNIDTAAFEKNYRKELKQQKAGIIRQFQKYHTTESKINITINEILKNDKIRKYQLTWLYTFNTQVDNLINVIYGPTSAGKSHTIDFLIANAWKVYFGLNYFINLTTPKQHGSILVSYIEKFCNTVKKSKTIEANTIDNKLWGFSITESLYSLLKKETQEIINSWIKKNNQSVFFYNSKNDKEFNDWLLTKKDIVNIATTHYYSKQMTVFDSVAELNKNYFTEIPIKLFIFDEGHNEAHSSCEDSVSSNMQIGRTNFGKTFRLFVEMRKFGFIGNVATGTPSFEQRAKSGMTEEDFKSGIRDLSIKKQLDEKGKYRIFRIRDLTKTERVLVALNNSPLDSIISIKDNWIARYGDKIPMNYESKLMHPVLNDILDQTCFSRKGITLVQLTPKGRLMKGRGMNYNTFEAYAKSNLAHKSKEILYWFTGNHRLASSSDLAQFDGMNIDDVLSKNPQIKLVVVVNKLTTGVSINNINTTIVLKKIVSKNNEYITPEQFIGRGVRFGCEDLMIVFLDIDEEEKQIINRILIERQVILPRKEHDILSNMLNPMLENVKWFLNNEMFEGFKTQFKDYCENEFVGNVISTLNWLKSLFHSWNKNDGGEWKSEDFHKNAAKFKTVVSTILSTILESRLHESCDDAIERGGSKNKQDMDIRLNNEWLAIDFKCSTRLKMSTSEKFNLCGLALKDSTRSNDGKVCNGMLYVTTRLYFDEKIDEFELAIDLIEFHDWHRNNILDSQLKASSDKHQVRNLIHLKCKVPELQQTTIEPEIFFM